MTNTLIDNVTWFVKENQPMDNVVLAQFLHVIIDDETEALYMVQ